MKNLKRWIGETECNYCGNYMTKGWATDQWKQGGDAPARFCQHCVSYFLKVQARWDKLTA